MSHIPTQDLGSGVRADVARYGTSGCCVVEVHHRTPKGAPCTARLDLRGGASVRVVSPFPLHLAVTVVCPYCGFSGSIEGGRWLPFTPRGGSAPERPHARA